MAKDFPPEKVESFFFFANPRGSIIDMRFVGFLNRLTHLPKQILNLKKPYSFTFSELYGG